jgi:hypothetical protein
MAIGILKKIKILSTLMVVGCLGSALAVPGDYDADGTSDLSVALVNKTAKTTAWLTRPTNGGSALFWTWGLPGDALVSGRFHPNDPKYYPGIVYVRSSSFPLEWYIKTAAGTDAFIKFGLPGDTVPNQGDFDGDGMEDLTVVRNVGGQLVWYVALSGSGGQVAQYSFGLNGDKVGVSDVDGDGKVEMVALRSGFQWYIGNPRTGSVTAPQQWGLAGDIYLLPTDIDGDRLADFVITRRTGSFQVAYIKYGNGATQNTTLGFDSSIPQMGFFVRPLPTFAWSQRDTGFTAIRNFDGTPNVFAFGISTNAIIRADGTVVQPSEDGRFGGTSSGGGDTGGGGSANCTTTFGSGWLLKPAAQDTGGTRLGKPLILFTRNFPSGSCLNVIATDGTIVAKYGKFSSNRFYSGYGCGSFLSASQIASRAVAATGSKNIFVQNPANGACYGPGPADGRTDKR